MRRDVTRELTLTNNTTRLRPIFVNTDRFVGQLGHLSFVVLHEQQI